MHGQYQFKLDLIFNKYLSLMRQYNVDTFIIDDFANSFKLIKTLPIERKRNWIYEGLTRKETFFKQLIKLPEDEFYEIGWDIEFVTDYIKKNRSVWFGKLSISSLFHSD